MPLDEQSAAFADAFERMVCGPPFSLPALRALSGGGARRRPDERGLRITDRTIPGQGRAVPVRVYRPETDHRPGVLVYCHGGGFVAGDLDTCDGVCRTLARLGDCITVSVDYRLAPEDRFPAGLQDAYSALEWVFANPEELGARPFAVAVGGDSAGGTFATTISMMARDRGAATPCFQLLIYPGINLHVDTAERRALAKPGHVLRQELLDWLHALYPSSPSDLDDPYFAPVNATNLADLPPALMIAAEFDPLRVENLAYAKRLTGAGVRTVYSQYPGTVHGFVSAFEMIDQGRAALTECGDALRRALSDRGRAAMEMQCGDFGDR